MTQFNLTPLRARRASVWLAALAIGMVALPVIAQTSGSSGLAEIYSNLPPDQQQAILQQVGGGQGSQGGQGAQGGTGASSATQSRSGSAATQNNQQNARSRAADAEAMLPHRLRGDDLILIEPDIQRQKLSWPTTAGTGAGAAQPLAGLPSGATSAPVVAPEVELRPEERSRLNDLDALIRSRNPYTLDSSGAIQLPGFAAIALAGLTEAQATRRLSAEPDLVKLDVKVTYLPVRRLGGAGLKPYGYDLFDEAQSTFAPLGDVPVPSDYVVGPGDKFSVQLYGSQNRTLALTVSRDGHLNFPELGPISVSGRRFSEVRADVESRVSRQMIGVRASLSMGDVRSIQVFVVGEARYPGAYTVSGLATVTGALFAAGGVKEIGSLRTIQLKRAGQTVRTLDLYDLLMRGDTSNDAKLLPGDAILIPPIGATVSVEGEVHRPAIYELKDSETMADAVRMAGGYTTEADQGSAALTRVNEQRRRVVLNVDLSSQASMAGMRLRNGDQLRVARLRPTLDAGVSVQGQVYRPGNYAWHEGMRLSELLPSVDELKAGADEHYVLIRRELAPDRRLVVRSADLAAALAAPGSAADVELMARDRITVFDLQTKRERVIKPLLDELQQQASQQQAPLVVNISGRVIVEGDYPLEENMKVADLIRAGGGLDPAAYGGTAELSRYVIENGQSRRAQIIGIDLAAVLHGDAAANVALQPFDRLYVKEISGWSEQDQVTLRGEVRFPGIYPIKRGESLRDVIGRAGGLTDLAFAEGSVFTRVELREREQLQLNRLTERLQNDLAATSLMAARGGQGNAAQTFSVGQNLLAQIRSAKAVGRLVLDLDATMAAAPGSAGDVTLKDGDELVIPKRSQAVTVIGEVQTQTSHLYNNDLERDDYIALSGGATRLADGNKIYVVRANGSVVPGPAHFWSRTGRSAQMHAGDTIVVPLDTERVPALPMWQSITTILYNVAIAVAAIHSFK